ncbi:glycosyltransferase family 2 protein [Crateriforma spongiae]|uniref:glycosyltransferase family 2 protein n=1 Tax=Crateriforma spongiae TaxID=2724528 RepID=UPI0039B08227
MSDSPTQPRFSIVTVCLNCRDDLEKTFESIRCQKFKDYEWCVVDGGSQDSTGEFLRSISMVGFGWTSEPDDGIFDGMNKGIERATGQYVIFMNAGDLLADDSVLTRVHEAIGDASPGLVYGDAIEFDGKGNEHYKRARDPAANRYSMFTHHQSQFYLLSCLKKDGFSQKYELSADWALTTRILRRRDALRVEGPVCRYLRGGVSMRPERRRQINSEMFEIHRTEQGVSLPIAFLLSVSKLSANKLREVAPGLYDRIRFRRAN